MSRQVDAVAKEIWAARRQRVRETAGDDIGSWESENEFLHENVRAEARAAIAATALSKCTSWLGHKFEARYSTSNPALRELFAQATRIETLHAHAMQAMQDHEYCVDICVRCGFVVERKTTESASKTTA